MNVSILVCTHGSAEWEERGLQAASKARREQDAFDVIAVHSQDGTLAEVRNEVAYGAVATDYLCFLDADDELAPGYLDAMRAAFTRGWDRDYPIGPSFPALFVPALQRVHTAANGQTRQEPPVIPDWGRLLIDLNCAVIGTLVPRPLFLRVGGFHDWPAYEDWDLWLRCVRAGARLVPVPDAVYRAHVGAGSRNVADPAVNARTYQLIRAAHDDVPPSWWRDRKVDRL